MVCCGVALSAPWPDTPDSIRETRRVRLDSPLQPTLSGSQDGKVRFWKVADVTLLHTLEPAPARP
jgi:hypothetical protein